MMENLDLDTRLLSEFLYALNIARRQVSAYPLGHPIITSAAERLLVQLEKLLEFRREVTLGIARDTLLIDGKQLDPTNPVYRDLAVNLFTARVASLTLQSGATVNEVLNFFQILNYPHDRIASEGGLAVLMTAAGIHCFKVQEIDYRAFCATEVESLSAPKVSGLNEESAVLWKAFANGMVRGTIDPNGVRQLPQEQFDPTLLAEAMNSEQQTNRGRVAGSYDQAIAEFLQQSDRQQLNDPSRQELFDRLGLFIEQLSPELRRRFLNSTLKGLSARPNQASQMLANWSHSTIIEALEYVEADQLQVPRILLDILGKLGAQPNSASSQRHVAATMPHNRHQTAELLDRLLRDGNHESYVPDDYSDALAVLAAADVATSLDPNQVDELLDTLNGHALERQFCAILLDLLEQDIGIRSAEAIKRNLEELVPYFLETGDFVSLTRIHDHLSRKLDETHQPLVSFVNSALDIFAGENFIAQVLDGLDNWGKDQHPAIREMMGRIGLPFVTPLLDILAEEPVMARRRLYMDCLRRIGSQALESIAARLSDPRWYVVRNLVILVREINDPGALHSLSRLVGHAHPKVQYEVIRTYLHFNDPRADRHLLRELEQNDAGILVGVVKLAANSRNPEVARRLTELLNARGASDQELALKSTIINSLAEMGCVDALPGLAAFIESRSLFMARPLHLLKVEAVESLGRYASPEAVDLAARIHQKSTGDIARAAEKICLRVRGLTP